MKEIQEIVNAKVASMAADGLIQQAIEDGVHKAIEAAIKSQFESYGSITKQIETAMKEGLQIDVKDLPFEAYNEQMLVAVKGRLGALFQGAASEKFMSEIDKVLAPVPKEMSINELVETIAKFWKTDEPWDADHLDNYATVELEATNYGGHSLRMWKKKETSSFRTTSPDVHLYISGGTVRINHKHGYNPTCFDDDDAFIFKLYSAGTVITGVDEFDADDCELTLKERD